MSVISTPGVNFINIKSTNFSYKCRVVATFSSYMHVEKRCSYKKFVCKMLMRLTTCAFAFCIKRVTRPPKIRGRIYERTLRKGKERYDAKHNKNKCLFSFFIFLRVEIYYFQTFIFCNLRFSIRNTFD